MWSVFREDGSSIKFRDTIVSVQAYMTHGMYSFLHRLFLCSGINFTKAEALSQLSHK